MKAHKNTITFNGRVYDASTGKAVTSTATSAAVPKKVRVTEPHVVKPDTAAPKTKAQPISIAVKDVGRSGGQGATAIHVKTERPKTLMRKAVKKPVRTATKSAATGLIAQPNHTVIHGSIADRQERAVHTLQSKHISKFATASPNITHKTAEIPVKSAPATHSVKRATYNIKDTPPAPHHSTTPVRHSQRNIFEEALSSATSHQSKKHRTTHSVRKRKNRMAAGLASILLLAGFFTYQNIPRIALSRASSQIGFNARVPAFQPAGFARSGPIQYQKGLVVINFQSTSDDRAYSITQAQSNADNTTLGKDYLTKQGKDYEIAEVNGLNVYLYGAANVTWIKRGVWYTIEGNAGLSRDQLLKISASM